MKKNKHRFFVWLFVIAAGICIWMAVRHKGQDNGPSDYTPGNTAGNLYNRGLFCESDGILYFSNLAEDGALYQMNLDGSNLTEVTSDKVRFLNADEEHVYYSCANHAKESSLKSFLSFYNTGLFQIDKDGTDKTVLETEACGLTVLAGDEMLYQRYTTSTAINLYTIGTNKTGKKQLTKNAILPACIEDGILYYSNVEKDHAIYTMDLETKETALYYDGNTMMPILMDHWLYYISLSDGYALCRIDRDSLEKEILVEDFISTYNITEDGRYLIYQIDGGDHNRIEFLDTTTGDVILQKEGNYKSIHTTSIGVFFLDYEETTIYHVPLPDTSIKIWMKK
ncbi:MAG: DUF5050 domain-containing protein [Lachnospiraceae bacterium]|nr:DUF5050 domain-containing protein [Lachnospiraceae bacterium]